jgi:hypothetical protein
VLAVHLCHVRFVIGYFAVLIAWAIVSTVSSGRPAADAGGAVMALGLLGVAIVALLCLFAYGVARTTVYTLTNRRLILRYGIALTKAVNVPFANIASADLRLYSNGYGDLAVTVAKGKLAYLILWPHARPWRFKSPEPMLRGIPDAERVAGLLKSALTTGDGARAATTPVKPAPVPPGATALSAQAA